MWSLATLPSGSSPVSASQVFLSHQPVPKIPLLLQTRHVSPTAGRSKSQRPDGTRHLSSVISENAEFQEVDLETKLSCSTFIYRANAWSLWLRHWSHAKKERRWVTPKIQGFVSSSECAVRLATACTTKVRHTSPLIQNCQESNRTRASVSLSLASVVHCLLHSEVSPGVPFPARPLSPDLAYGSQRAGFD